MISTLETPPYVHVHSQSPSMLTSPKTNFILGPDISSPNPVGWYLGGLERKLLVKPRKDYATMHVHVGLGQTQRTDMGGGRGHLWARSKSTACWGVTPDMQSSSIWGGGRGAWHP